MFTLSFAHVLIIANLYLLAFINFVSILSIGRLLNTAARLMARLPRFCHISTYTSELLHWLPVTARIHFKILLLTYIALTGQAPILTFVTIRQRISAASLRPLCSLNRFERLVESRSRTAMVQHRASARIGHLLSCPP